ncbi:MAG: O-antigen ligase family protein [Flavobacteriales bacterium]|nr:O-antigen ligase family protein [Flavobacteriales bacterium]
MFPANFHRLVYLLGIAILLTGMPLSPAMMSISQFVLLINWIVEGNFKNKFDNLKSNTPVLLIIGLFSLHLIWLINTADYAYGLHDIKAKLPLLIIPFVLGSAIKLTLQEINRFLLLFIAAIVAASVACLFKLWGWIGEPVDNIRKMSFIISHIRFGLMICMAIFASVYLIFKGGYQTLSKFLLGIITVWLVLFLGVMSAITALLILGVITLAGAVIFTFKRNTRLIFISITTLSIMALSAVLFWASGIYDRQFSLVEESNISKLDKATSNGNKYYHSPTSISMENGRYVYHHICEKEIVEAWSKRSSYTWNGKNTKGKDIRGAMYRFITSKGLRKDKDGINALSDDEIQAIENGITSVDLMNRGNLYKRIHQTIWELGNYRLGIPAGGNSLTQRFEFWKAALIISKENLFLGVGTGDVKLAYEEIYNKDDFGLGTKYRKRAHNQYLTFLITFGILGFTFFLFSMVYPLTTKQHPLFYVFMAIILISYLNEDTLESQAGATFFAGFFGLLNCWKSSTPKNTPA